MDNKKKNLVAVKLSDAQLKHLDELVQEGKARNRSDAIQSIINKSILGLK